MASWGDEWVVAARRAEEDSREGLLLVWHRPGPSRPLHLPALRGTTLQQVFPPAHLVPGEGLHVQTLPEGPCITPVTTTPAARAYLVREDNDRGNGAAR